MLSFMSALRCCIAEAMDSFGKLLLVDFRSDGAGDGQPLICIAADKLATSHFTQREYLSS